MTQSEAQVKQLIKASGIKINGKNPWDINVHNDKFYDRVLAHGSLGLGESYMDGWWTTQDLEGMVQRLVQMDVSSQIKPSLKLVRYHLMARARNSQTVRRAYKNAQSHYDIGNDLYEPMLGRTMAYSCAYWKGVKNLDDAQDAKLELICKKLQLKPGMRVLDIGCGWGSLALYMAKHYKVEVVGITPAKEQAAYVRANSKGLSVKVLEQDYREFKTRQKFDRVVSVGMAEHIGPKNYLSFMKKVDEVLQDDGIFLLHTIGSNHSAQSGDAWMDKYIFPGAVIPSVAQLARAAEKKFVIEDVHNFGLYYEKTLLAWYKNFKKAWPKLEDKYGKRFYKMWEFYLLSCAAMFKARELQLWQFVMTKQSRASIYEAVR